MTRKQLGQNFLYDPSLLGRIIDAAGITGEDTVIEIGPGPGRLTRMLADRVKNLIAIELDSRLYERLKGDFIAYNNVEIVHGDVLQFPFEDISEFKVVSNIPYYITTPILFRLLDARQHVKSITLTIQKEVAERIVARPGGKDYGVLTIMVQYVARPELKFIIAKEAFRPVPKVDSAVVYMKILEQPAVKVRNEKLFFSLVRTAFAQRRKTLSNSLKGFGDNMKAVLHSIGIDPSRRPETLSMEEFSRLAEILTKE